MVRRSRMETGLSRVVMVMVRMIIMVVVVVVVVRRRMRRLRRWRKRRRIKMLKVRMLRILMWIARRIWTMLRENMPKNTLGSIMPKLMRIWARNILRTRRLVRMKVVSGPRMVAVILVKVTRRRTKTRTTRTTITRRSP